MSAYLLEVGIFHQQRGWVSLGRMLMAVLHCDVCSRLTALISKLTMFFSLCQTDQGKRRHWQLLYCHWAYGCVRHRMDDLANWWCSCLQTGDGLALIIHHLWSIHSLLATCHLPLAFTFLFLLLPSILSSSNVCRVSFFLSWWLISLKVKYSKNLSHTTNCYYYRSTDTADEYRWWLIIIASKPSSNNRVDSCFLLVYMYADTPKQEGLSNPEWSETFHTATSNRMTSKPFST